MVSGKAAAGPAGAATWHPSSVGWTWSPCWPSSRPALPPGVAPVNLAKTLEKSPWRGGTHEILAHKGGNVYIYIHIYIIYTYVYIYIYICLYMYIHTHEITRDMHNLWHVFEELIGTVSLLDLGMLATRPHCTKVSCGDGHRFFQMSSHGFL